MRPQAALSHTAICALAFGAFLLVACSSPPPAPGPAEAQPPGAATAMASAASSASKFPAPIFTESDFTETEINRDPFRSFAKKFAPIAAEVKVVAPQYTVLLEKYPVEDLKLVAIVSSHDSIRAMFVDPNGKGWTVTRGLYLGKGEVIRVGTGSTSYPLFWKVDRIKPSAVILIREDPMHPELAPTYKEIAMHVEG